MKSFFKNLNPKEARETEKGNKKTKKDELENKQQDERLKLCRINNHIQGHPGGLVS